MLLLRPQQFLPSYATMKVSSITRAIVNDTSWFEGPVASYSSWVEVLIGGWHLWGTTGDLLHKFTMHWAFWLSKPCHTIHANSSNTSGNNRNRKLQNVYIIPMMNSVARLSLIFSLTTTTNHFPFPHICNKTSIMDGTIIHASLSKCT